MLERMSLWLVGAIGDMGYVGLVLLFSTDTGEPLAIFPDGVLQRMRVGATSAIGAKKGLWWTWSHCSLRYGTWDLHA